MPRQQPSAPPDFSIQEAVLRLQGLRDRRRSEYSGLQGWQLSEVDWAIERAEKALERYSTRRHERLRQGDLGDVRYYTRRAEMALNGEEYRNSASMRSAS